MIAACDKCVLWSKRLIRVRQAISVSGLRWSRACRHHFNGDSGPGSATCFFGDTYNLNKRDTQEKQKKKSKKLNEEQNTEELKEMWEQNAGRGSEKLSLIYFLLSMLVRSSGNCRVEDLNKKQAAD